VEQAESYHQDKNRERDSQKIAVPDEQKAWIVVEDRLAADDHKSETSIEYHASQGDDESRYGKSLDEISVKPTNQQSQDQHHDYTQPNRETPIHQEHGQQNSRKSDERSHRKVDPSNDDYPSHSKSDDGVQGSLINHVQEVSYTEE